MSHAIAVSHGAFGRAAIYELDRTIVTHAHREGHLIFYVGGAEAAVTVGEETFPVDAADAVAVSPWEPHSFSVEGGEPCMCLTLYIKPVWFLEHSPTTPLALNFGRPALEMTQRLTECATRLTALLLDDDSRIPFDKILYQTAQTAFEASWADVEQSEQLRRTCGRFTDFRVRRSLRLMQENFAEEVEMRHLAREVGLSRPHFFKLFKRQMGVTPAVYLNTLRAEQAIEELLATPKSVTDIAHDLGFSSQASFTRFFASNVGISPSEYRR
ncbi:MAG: AraC family transcriptional regulator, partial [Pseudomonadota bacterium]